MDLCIKYINRVVYTLATRWLEASDAMYDAAMAAATSRCFASTCSPAQAPLPCQEPHSPSRVGPNTPAWEGILILPKKTLYFETLAAKFFGNLELSCLVLTSSTRSITFILAEILVLAGGAIPPRRRCQPVLGSLLG